MANAIAHESDSTAPVVIGNRGASSMPATQGYAPALVEQALRSSGEPLDRLTRAEMEGRFGRDFGPVRVHSDAPAAASASEIDARSYTAGNHIVFAAGEYAPATGAGRALLAHELTHVVQQAGSMQVIQRQPKKKDADLPPVPGPVKPLDMTAELYKGLHGIGADKTDAEIAQQLEDLKDPEVRVQELLEKLSEEAREYSKEISNATRHERLVKYGILLRHVAVSNDNVREHLMDHLTMTDLQVLRKFGLDLPAHWFTRGKTIQRLLEAIDAYDADWQQKHVNDPNAKDENRALDGYLGDVAEIEAHHDAVIRKGLSDLATLSGAGPAGVVAMVVTGGNPDAVRAVAPLDDLLAAGSSMIETRSGMPYASSPVHEDPAAEVRRKAADDTTPTPDRAGAAAGGGAKGRYSPSADLHVPGPHPFFKKPAANENATPPDPRAQAARVPLAKTGTGGSVPAAQVAGDETVHTGAGAGGTKMSGTAPKRETVEQYKQRGGTVTTVDPGVSGQKNPPKPKVPVTAAPKGRSDEDRRAEHMGSDHDAPEVAATQSRKTPGGAAQRVGAEVGNFAHNSLPGYLDEMRANLERAKSPEARAELEQHISELRAMTQWPAGVKPNRLSFPMSDGRPGIPDGLDAENGIVYELKPNTESEWAQRGHYQASEYAAVLNKMKYAGRTDWQPRVITYDADALTQKLRDWGVLPSAKKK